MEFKVLGPLEVRRGEIAVPLPRGKPRAVLAMLLLHANEAVGAERLAVGLWGEDAPAGAARTVQVYVSRLRRALDDEELLVTTPAGYVLRVRPGELDAERFERLVGEGREALAAGRPEEAGAVLRDALGLWRGPALGELAFEPFAQAHAARLEEQRLAALEAQIESDLAAGRHAELIGDLQRLVGEHPLRERLHGQLMLALYRSGRQADALEAYRRAREVLVGELGIEPGPDLRALERAMLAQAPELDPQPRTDAGPSRPPAARPQVRVPLPPTRTIGRAAELAELRRTIADPAARLVTVVGPGGVGKTRVAVEVAREVGPDLRDGAVFVALAALQESERVGSTIARALDLMPAPGEAVDDALERHLAPRELLLVLDNFEHVLGAAALVARLAEAAPGLTVVATSREPLRVRAERLFHVGPLPVATGDGGAGAPPEAAALFAAVVQARHPEFELGPDSLPAVVEVCRRVDGLPLAIELAAGRVGLLSVSELAGRVRSGLDVLGQGQRDAPARQRTLEATLEWSHDLLDPEEQRVLAALAVFAGGCAVADAEAVTDAPLEVLESLVAKNLVLAGTGHAGSRRLAMLATVRAFARARLERSGEEEAIARRHGERYLALVERTRPELEWTGSPAVLAELDQELDNLRAAFAWALDRSPEAALRLASATALYWHLSVSTSEAIEWLDAALARSETVAAGVRAAALAYYAMNLAPREPERAERVARESLELARSAGDPSRCARSMSALAHVLLQAHRPRESYDCACEALQLATVARDEQARAYALGTMALAAPTLAEALRRGEEAAAVYRGAGNQRELAGLQTSLAYTALFLGEYGAAESLGFEALDAARRHGDPFVVALAEGNAGLAALFEGHTDAARRAFTGQLRLAGEHQADSRYDGFLFEALDGLAAVAAVAGHDRVAATLSAAAYAGTAAGHDPAIARALDDRFFAPARERLGASAWQEALAAGAALERDEAIAAALQSVPLRAAV
jgi:predicted ATPase/DNA-binding SARP family transcriptional activator